MLMERLIIGPYLLRGFFLRKKKKWLADTRIPFRFSFPKNISLCFAIPNDISKQYKEV